MRRLPRYVPSGGALVEVTYRTIQGRYLIRPSRGVNETLVGVLARATSFCTVKLIGIVALSNHLHLLLWVPNQWHLSKLLEHFGGNSAREVNRLHDWRGSMWERRYTGICVTEEEQAQVERLEYLLSQAVKEDLVETVEDWPGIHFGKTLLEGRSLLVGKWVDRTKKYRLEVQGKEVKPEDYTTTLTVELEQLPCWAHLSWRDYIRRISKMIREAERKAVEERARRGVEVVGAAAVSQRDPQTRPNRVKESPAPRVHAATKRMRLVWREAFALFLAAYREASELLRKGVLDAPFPEGCFPPGLPFVGETGGLAAATG